MLAALFELDDLGDWNDPRYNIAPQTRILTVRRRGKQRSGQSLLWGVQSPRDARLLINARSETVASSPLFGPAFARSRVLVPADGFFEWTREGGRKRAVYFQQEGGLPFAFAGIAVSSPSIAELGEPGAVILTTEASESVRSVHDRMPLLVRPPDFDTWLDTGANPRDAQAVIEAGRETRWTSFTVGPQVNNVRNDGPECVRPAAPEAERQGRLF